MDAALVIRDFPQYVIRCVMDADNRADSCNQEKGSIQAINCSLLRNQFGLHCAPFSFALESPLQQLANEFDVTSNGLPASTTQSLCLLKNWPVSVPLLGMLTPFEQQLYVIPAISTSEPPVHLHQYDAA